MFTTIVYNSEQESSSMYSPSREAKVAHQLILDTQKGTIYLPKGISSIDFTWIVTIRGL
jgi:hypothetical protein